MKNMTNIITSVKYKYLGFDIDTPPLFRAYESNIYPGVQSIKRRRMSAEDKSETLSIVSSNRSTINISSDSTERMETPPIATSPPVTVTTSTNGIENKGFVEDEKKNVEFEAVNLELVDLNKPSTPLSEPRVYAPPPQSQPAATQKFSDYYVSVNEHKKGLRGEKLYVTKDSRRGRGCKRYCCALLVLLVIAATVTIASLVGTGIIDTQPKFKGEINKSGRSRDLPPTNDSLISEPRPVIDNDIGDDKIEAKEILPKDAVPNVLEGQMGINNVAWDDRLRDSTNPFFSDMAQKVEKALYSVFISPMKEERADFFINVKKFERKDGVTPHYRVGWELKDNSFSDGVELITKEEMSDMMMKHLKSNNGRLNNVFDVPMESIRVKRVADDKCDTMQCHSFCSYDYPSNDFKCGCSQSFKLAEDGRTCIEDSTDPTFNVNLLSSFDFPSDAENNKQDIFGVDTTVSTLETTKHESSSQKSTIDVESDDNAKVPRLLNTSVVHDNGHDGHSEFESDHHRLDNEWKNTEFPLLESVGEIITNNASNLENTSDQKNYEGHQHDHNVESSSPSEIDIHSNKHKGEIPHYNREQEFGNIDQNWQSTQSNDEENPSSIQHGLESSEENWNTTSNADSNTHIENHNQNESRYDSFLLGLNSSNSGGLNIKGNEQHENSFDPSLHILNTDDLNNQETEQLENVFDTTLNPLNFNGQNNQETEQLENVFDTTLHPLNFNGQNNQGDEQPKDIFDHTLHGSNANGKNNEGNGQHENGFDHILDVPNSNSQNNQGNEQGNNDFDHTLHVSNSTGYKNQGDKQYKDGFDAVLHRSNSDDLNNQGNDQTENNFYPALNGSNSDGLNNAGLVQHDQGFDPALHGSNSDGQNNHENVFDTTLYPSNSNDQVNQGNEQSKDVFDHTLHGSNSDNQDNQGFDHYVTVSSDPELKLSKENQNENNGDISQSQNTDFEQSGISSDNNIVHAQEEHKHDQISEFSSSYGINDSTGEKSEITMNKDLFDDSNINHNQKPHYGSDVNNNENLGNSHVVGLTYNEEGNLNNNGQPIKINDTESNNDSNGFNPILDESNQATSTDHEDKEGNNQSSSEDNTYNVENVELSSSESKDSMNDQINGLDTLKQSSNINDQGSLLKGRNEEIIGVSSDATINSNVEDREFIANLGLTSQSEKDLNEEEQTGPGFGQQENENNYNGIETQDSTITNTTDKSEDEIVHQDPEKMDDENIYQDSEKEDDTSIHQGSEKQKGEHYHERPEDGNIHQDSIKIENDNSQQMLGDENIRQGSKKKANGKNRDIVTENDQSVADSSPFEDNQSIKESSIEDHYHGDIFHAGFQEDNSFADPDLNDNQVPSDNTLDSNREHKILTESIESENNSINNNKESNSSKHYKISNPTLQESNLEDDPTTSATTSENFTPEKNNPNDIKIIDNKNMDTGEELSDGVTTKFTSFISDDSEAQDFLSAKTKVNERPREFDFGNKFNQEKDVEATIKQNSTDDIVFDDNKSERNSSSSINSNHNTQAVLKNNDNFGGETLDHISQDEQESNSKTNKSTNIVISSSPSVDNKTNGNESINDFGTIATNDFGTITTNGFDTSTKETILIQNENEKIDSTERVNIDISKNTNSFDNSLVTASSAVKQSPEKVYVINSQDEQTITIPTNSSSGESKLQETDYSALPKESTGIKTESTINNDVKSEDTEKDKNQNLKPNISDQIISTPQTFNSDDAKDLDNAKDDITPKEENGSLETDQSTEKIRDDIFNDILHKFADGVSNINIQPETNVNKEFSNNIVSSNEINKSYENNLNNSENISQTKEDNEHIETLIGNTSENINEETKTTNYRNFDASDIVNKVGNIVIKSDNDKKETKSRISGSIGNGNSFSETETSNSKTNISEENVKNSNAFPVKDQSIFTNTSHLDPELIQKIILRNVLNNNQTNPFHHDTQPYQFGLQYPNGTEAVFNFNGTTLDSSLIPTFILGNSTHEDIRENITTLPNGQSFTIPSHQQQLNSTLDAEVLENGVPSSSFNKNQAIFGGFQLPNGTILDVTSNLSKSFLHGIKPQIQFDSENAALSKTNESDDKNQVIFGGFQLPNGTKIDLTSNFPIQQNLGGFFINNGSSHSNFSGIANNSDINQLLINSAYIGNDSSFRFNFPNEKDLTKLVLKQLLNNSNETAEANNETGIENIVLQNIIHSIKGNLNSSVYSEQNLGDYFTGNVNNLSIFNNSGNNSNFAQLLLQSALHPNSSTGDSLQFGINFPDQNDVFKLVLQQLFNKSNETDNNGTRVVNPLVQSVLDLIIQNNNGSASFNPDFLASNGTDIQKMILSNLLQNATHNSTLGFPIPREEEIKKIVINQILQQNEDNSSTELPVQNGDEIQQQILSGIKSSDGNTSFPFNSNETNVQKSILQNQLDASNSERDQELNIFKEIVLGQTETTTEKDMGNITEILKQNPIDFKSLSGADFSSHILGRMQKSSRKIKHIFDKGCKDPENEFQCIGHGDCLSKHLRCNGIYDCRDGSDELLCEKEGLKKEKCQEFQCPNGPCIPSDRKCDGQIDCPESYDELDCHSTSFNCSENEFYCVKDARCIASSFRCDGTPDCVREDEDERNCDCDSESQFKCMIGGGCIDKEKVCDGVEDCPDLSDEFNCLKTLNGKIQIRGNNDTWSTICFNEDSSLEFATATCQQLGYASAKFEGTTVENEESSNYKELSSDVSLTDIKKIDAKVLEDILVCENNPKTVCEEFECSNRTLTERQINELHAQGTININSLTSENELWPSLAYLFNVKMKTSCVVTILNPMWLITSHGCMAEKSMDPLEWVAFAGPANGQADQSKTQIKIVRRIVSNPSARFQQGYYTDDLALVELNDPLIFNDQVRASCLGESPLEDELCFVAGWTDVNKEGVSFIQYLDKIPLPMMSQEECNSQSHYNNLLNSNSLCTSSKHQDVPCRMDSGAPLLCYQGNRWRLHGILSREGECLPSTHPDIFTSVDSWKSWINNIIGENES